jgi:hypothetical protein
MQGASDDEREIRAARNQAIFRAINEQIRAVNEAFGALTNTFSIACECYDARCIEMVEIEPATYEQTRAHPHRFVVRPGHVLGDIEHTVVETDEYAIVQKVDTAAEVAEALDPRGT